jgi:hypothetical protein
VQLAAVVFHLGLALGPGLLAGRGAALGFHDVFDVLEAADDQEGGDYYYDE